MSPGSLQWLVSSRRAEARACCALNQRAQRPAERAQVGKVVQKSVGLRPNDALPSRARDGAFEAMQKHIGKDKTLMAKAERVTMGKPKSESKVRNSSHARDLRSALEWLRSHGRPDRDRQDGRPGPRSHRPAEAHGWRLPGAVQQRQGQAQSPRASPICSAT